MDLGEEIGKNQRAAVHLPACLIYAENMRKRTPPSRSVANKSAKEIRVVGSTESIEMRKTIGSNPKNLAEQEINCLARDVTHANHDHDYRGPPFA